MQADTSPEHVPLKLRERFRELEQAIQETKQLLARLRELGAKDDAEQAAPRERPEDEQHERKDVTSRLVAGRMVALQGFRVRSA